MAKNYEFTCQSLSKVIHMEVRVYLKKKRLYSYSVYHMEPDPVEPFREQILDDAHSSGILVTPLHQVYGYLSLGDDWRLVIGPSRLTNEDSHTKEEQLFLLGVPLEKQKDYLRALRCMPVCSAERMGWLLSFISWVVEHKKLHFEDLHVNFHADLYSPEIQQKQVVAMTETKSSTADYSPRDQKYYIEQLMMSYVRSGEPERLRELFDASPNFEEIVMTDNTLRQIKDTCICTAAIVSREAIESGMEPATALHLNDLYIQQFELLQDIHTLEHLRKNMILEFAEQVQQVLYRTEKTEGGDDALFKACVEYVGHNIYKSISIEEMAHAVGYKRAYLGDRFKKQTGVTLTKYVTQQKVIEAQRILRFTSKSLGEIAELLAFSSQSHFQNTFKKMTGETPLTYRKRVQRMKKAYDIYVI